MFIKMAEYDITIESGCLKELPSLIAKVHEFKQLYIITDQHLFDLYHDELVNILHMYHVQFVTITPGEASKSLDTYVKVINTLIEKGIKRTDFILAFGGGVVGDLTGFIAATLYRGIHYAHIPTSLLAMVDSSIGSKVGIDLPQGKNLIGAFNPPKFVLIDPLLLKTLKPRDYRNGLAEMIKAGLIRDKKLYMYLLEHEEVTEQEIAAAIFVKRELVLNDPYDKKERMLLNFGHTFGHAIEKKHRYETYLHGEAISYGMLIALECGIKLGLTKPELYEEVKALLIKRELVKEPLLKLEDYKDDMIYDKKNLSDGFRFIIVNKPGDASIIKINIEDFS